MMSVFRTLFVVLLTVLQLFAPLVHAHAGLPMGSGIEPASGVPHIPGLEAYVGVGRRLVTDATLLCASRFNSPVDGIIVSVGDGVSKYRDGDSVGPDRRVTPRPVAVAQARLLRTGDSRCNSLPALPGKFYCLQHPTRAPPAPRAEDFPVISS